MNSRRPDDPIDPMNPQKGNRRPDVDNETGGRLDRRSFIKLAAGGVSLGALGAVSFSQLTKGTPRRPVRLTVATWGRERKWHFVATDGFAAMPDPSIVAPVGVYYPDLGAPEGQNLYTFGFNDVTDIEASRIHLSDPWDPSGLTAPIDFKGLCQISAPLLYCDDGDDIQIRLENIGLSLRPDLFDPHTIHWHGFANQIPTSTACPTLAVGPSAPSSPIAICGRCRHVHVPLPRRDVEHVTMGSHRMVFIRPTRQPEVLGGRSEPRKKYAYYDASTEYDREYAILLTEANVENHGTTPTSWRATGASTARRSSDERPSWPTPSSPRFVFDATISAPPRTAWRDRS